MSSILNKTVKTLKNWWVFTLTGIILAIASIYVAYTPLESYVALTWIFSALILISGIAHAYFAIENRKLLDGWGWYLAGGIFELIVGIALLYYPEVSAVMLPIYVGFYFLYSGVQLIANSIELKNYGVLDWGWIMFFGIALSVIAFFMIIDPIFGFFNVVYLTSLGLMIAGISSISFSLKLKKIKAETLDRVKDFKRMVKNGVKDLKKEILENLESLPQEEAEELENRLDNYESRVNAYS